MHSQIVLFLRQATELKHMLPVFGPRLAPAHLAPACLAGFAGHRTLQSRKICNTSSVFFSTVDHAKYWVAGKILIVATGLGGKSNLCRNIPAEGQARQLLLELAKEGKA